MGIIFAVLSPAIYSVSNYVDKFVLEKFNLHPVVISTYTGCIALLTSFILLPFTGFYTGDITSITIVVLSGILTEMYLLPYFKALTLDETSRVVPLFQFVPIFILILSFLLLGEKLIFKQYVGGGFIIVAGFLLSLQKLQTKPLTLRPAFYYMMLSSGIYAFSVVLYKFGLKEIPFWQTLPLEGFGIGVGALCIFLYGNNRTILKKKTKTIQKKVFVYMGVNECIYLLARYTTYFALSLISASIVSILAGFQPLFIVAYGIILSIWFPNIIKEVVTKKTIALKLTAILLIFFGLYLLFF